MKKFALFLYVLLGSMTTVSAADVGSFKDNRAVTSAPVDYVPVPSTWTGPYIGAQIGYGTANHEVDATVSGDGQSYELFNLNGLGGTGAIGGVNGGFDFQRERVVFGPIGGYSFTGIETSLEIANGQLKATLEKGDEWHLGGRAGVLVTKSTLLYVGAAYVSTSYELSATGGTSLERDYDGVKVLAGIETQIGRGISAKVEYQGNFYGDVDWLNENGLRVTDNLQEHAVLFGVNYKLGLEDMFGR